MPFIIPPPTRFHCLNVQEQDFQEHFLMEQKSLFSGLAVPDSNRCQGSLKTVVGNPLHQKALQLPSPAVVAMAAEEELVVVVVSWRFRLEYSILMRGQTRVMNTPPHTPITK